MTASRTLGNLARRLSDQVELLRRGGIVEPWAAAEFLELTPGMTFDQVHRQYHRLMALATRLPSDGCEERRRMLTAALTRLTVCW